MDINSLLSPQDSPADETPPPLGTPQGGLNKRPRGPPKRTSSNLSQQSYNSASPQPRSQLPTPSGSYYGLQSAAPPLPSPSVGVTSAPRTAHSTTSTLSADMRASPLGTIHEERPAQRPMQRQSSGMDTLADLASMQQHHHHQPKRQSLNGLQDPQIYDHPHVPSRTSSFSLPSLPRTLSTRSAKDFAMADAPASPRVYTARSLSHADSEAISQLVQYLSENSYDYNSHVRLINLLHKGFIDHAAISNDPHSYELLQDLRQARQTMDYKYPVGEELWVDWINDEKLLARSTDERIAVMELCAKAVGEEPSSAVLWRLYGDYMHFLWTAAYKIDAPEAWTEEDKIIGKEVFKWEPMMEVWERGVAATQWRLNDSHLVWNRCIEIMMEDQQRYPTSDKVRNLMALFSERLTKPHATWEETFQMFSSFVSAYDNSSYEEIMTGTNKRAAQAKQQYALREPFELKIQQAARNGDKNAEWYAYTEYLDWEVRKKGVFSFHLINALYERATLRFATDATLWEDYVEFLIGETRSEVNLLSVLERATRHCPWSGSLWSHRILALEAEGRVFQEIEEIKHKATSSGLLDVGGMEDLLKVYIAWCGFLRRRAFNYGNTTEDDLDIAEVGIHSALEHVREIGERKYGKDYKGDPQYRLERIHINFYSRSNNIEAARELWRQLIPLRGDSYDFWYRYYIWEMVIWAKVAIPDNSTATTRLSTPREATAVLKQALKRVATMDWPEQLTTMYLNHCEQHESVQEYRSAIITARKADKQIAQRRAAEAAEAQAAAAQQQQQTLDATADIAAQEESASAKRKRDADATDLEEMAAKRSRGDDTRVDVPFGDASSSATSQLKRDREHTTIIVRNLPIEATETRVRQFFRDCGTINSINLVTEHGGQTATIEFETQEDAKFAQSRDGRDFDGSPIQISFGTATTLWVTNYPPEADEGYLRNLFKDHGEIIEIRFPSLQKNTHRRFCYIQFLTAAQAEAASAALNGKKLDKQHTLRALISDPSRKDDRHGATYEGREVFIANLHFKTTEDELVELAQAYGTLEGVRIPRKVNNTSTGIAFAVYANKDEAAAAAKALHGKEFKGRELRANISEPNAKGAKRHATTIISSASPEPGATAASPGSIHSANAAGTADDYRARTIALLNIPDTVNDARVRALVSQHGQLRKLILKPENGGAIVEFANVQDVGKASLALEGHEILPGRKIRVGTVEELKREKGERKVDRIGGGVKKDSKKARETGPKSSAPPAAAGMLGGGRVSRPGQAGARKGGNLGVKRGGVYLGGPRAGDGVHEPDTTAAGAGGAKSNADFKALFLKSQEGKDKVDE
ncbi:Splicing factor [Coniosporium apollinis]|uniref:Splicing factor n=1 Tax=Coniosporium apollinis TaxID=61459 RepID=A0ABQ9NKV0_9PEZI|nr:Splicing factor [Coniosporium apollinis]